MAESVEIVIAAKDQASARLRQIAGETDRLARSVKTSGQGLKSSSEFAALFARSLGGGQFGEVASEIGQVSERMGQFAEASKASAAGALALKAGVVAATALVAVKVGESLGHWVFQTEKFKKQLEDAVSLSKELSNQQIASMQKGFGFERQKIDAQSGDDREKAIQERIAELQKTQAAVEGQVQASQAQLQKREAARDKWSLGATVRRGEYQAEAKAAADAVAEAKQRLAVVQQELQAMRELGGEGAKELESLKAQTAQKERSASYVENLRQEIELLKAKSAEERNALDAKRNAPASEGEARKLLAERDALAAAAQAREKAAAETKRVEELQKSELERLRQRTVLIEQGAEAARRYALEQQGVSGANAAAIASADAAVSKLEALKGAMGQDGTLKANESRTLSRGEGNNAFQNALKKEFDRSIKEVQATNAELAKILAATQQKAQTSIEVVG